MWSYQSLKHCIQLCCVVFHIINDSIIYTHFFLSSCDDNSIWNKYGSVWITACFPGYSKKKGRYWGAFEELRYLHFNVCYYAAIEHCLREGVTRFEPGAVGEFKHLRGFDARPTVSMHYIADPRFARAVRDYLAKERQAVANEIEWLDEQSALKERPDF